MASEGAGAVQDEPGDLLLAADVARLGGHPETAVVPLSKVISAHSGDSRAPLAAFTLGRTLLDQLGRPREAAQAFATARRLDPRGALTQDALAREVESWSRAGEATLAHERAAEYVERYPKGRRLVAVKRLGGLE
jgi:transmembrane sensor